MTTLLQEEEHNQERLGSAAAIDRCTPPRPTMVT